MIGLTYSAKDSEGIPAPSLLPSYIWSVHGCTHVHAHARACVRARVCLCVCVCSGVLVPVDSVASDSPEDKVIGSYAQLNVGVMNRTPAPFPRVVVHVLSC